MKNYTYNKDQFEFYVPDGSCVQAYQIEKGNVWTLEIFPPNQSTYSFESGQYSGGITFYSSSEPAPATVLGEDTIPYEFYVQEYPETWTEKLKKEFIEAVKDELDDIELLEVEKVGE